MADVLEGAGFWLPSEFFADDDFLKDQENFNSNGKTESDCDFCFPTEFPYDFKTENGEHLEKGWVISTSPQSTLGNWSGRSFGGSSNGSPNGIPSPPTIPLGGKNDAVVDLIYRAAGQVAKLKLNSGNGTGSTKHEGLLAPPRSLAQLYPEVRTSNLPVFQNTRVQQHMMKQQNQGCGMLYSQQQPVYNRNGRTVGGVGQSAWTNTQNPTRNLGSDTRAVSFCGSGGGGGGVAAVKRECAGTGVFLPRRYGNDSNTYSSESRRKPVCSTSLLQERNAPALSKNFHSMKTFVQVQSKSQAHFSGGLISDYDLLMARRNAIMLQYQRSLLSEKSMKPMMGRDICLPQEWNY